MFIAALFVMALVAANSTGLLAYITAAAALLTAVAIGVTAFATLRGQRKLHDGLTNVATQVETTNGLTIAALAERSEGYRIQADIPHADRTTSEQGYVDVVEATGRNAGHTGPLDKTIVAGEAVPTTQAERDVRPGGPVIP